MANDSDLDLGNDKNPDSIMHDLIMAADIVYPADPGQTRAKVIQDIASYPDFLQSIYSEADIKAGNANLSGTKSREEIGKVVNQLLEKNPHVQNIESAYKNAIDQFAAQENYIAGLKARLAEAGIFDPKDQKYALGLIYWSDKRIEARDEPQQYITDITANPDETELSLIRRLTKADGPLPGMYSKEEQGSFKAVYPDAPRAREIGEVVGKLLEDPEFRALEAVQNKAALLSRLTKAGIENPIDQKYALRLTQYTRELFKERDSKDQLEIDQAPSEPTAPLPERKQASGRDNGR